MSLKHEQYRALKRSREFLAALLHHSTRPKKVSELVREASACLRHYPFLDEKGKPLFSKL